MWKLEAAWSSNSKTKRILPRQQRLITRVRRPDTNQSLVERAFEGLKQSELERERCSNVECRRAEERQSFR